MTTPSSSFPSSGRESSNTSTPPKSSPTLPSKMQLALPLYRADAVDLDLRAKGLRAQVLRAGPHVGDAPEPVLEAASPASRIIAASKPAPAMTAKRSPLNRPTSSCAAPPCSPTATASSMSLGMPRLVANRFAVPAGTIARLTLRAGEHVDAALHHPVAAPGEDQLRTLVERALDLRRRLAALRHLAPERIVDSLGCENATKLGEAALRASCRSARRRRPSLRPSHLAAAPAARHAKTMTISAQRCRRRRRPRRRAGGACRDTSAPAATNATIASDDRPDADARKSAVREPRREQQHEPAVDRDRCRGVAGRIAGVDRQVLETDDAGRCEWTTSVVMPYDADSTPSAKTTNAARRHCPARRQRRATIRRRSAARRRRADRADAATHPSETMSDSWRATR